METEQNKVKLKCCWQFITGLCLKFRHKKIMWATWTNHRTNWYSMNRRPKHVPEFVVVFLLYFFNITAFLGHFCSSWLSCGCSFNTHIHTVYNLTQISVVFALQETHCVIFAVSTKADVEVTQYKHESRASSFLILVYVHVFLFSKDTLNCSKVSVKTFLLLH